MVGQVEVVYLGGVGGGAMVHRRGGQRWVHRGVSSLVHRPVVSHCCSRNSLI